MLFVKSLLVASSSSTPRTKYCTHRLKLNLRLTRCTEIRYCRTAGEVCRWADVHWSSNDTLRQVHNLLKTTLAHALQSCHVWVCQKMGSAVYTDIPQKKNHVHEKNRPAFCRSSSARLMPSAGSTGTSCPSASLGRKFLDDSPIPEDYPWIFPLWNGLFGSIWGYSAHFLTAPCLNCLMCLKWNKFALKNAASNTSSTTKA